MVNISEDFPTDSSCMFPDRQTLISAQKEDRELKSIYEEAEQLKEQDDLSEASYVLKNDVLYRLIRPVTASTDEEWKKDVVRHCKSCHQCRMVEKSNQKITKAPLIPIPAVEKPFTKIVIDIVGPLPKTKTGFQYMLIIMDRTTRFPEMVYGHNVRGPLDLLREHWEGGSGKINSLDYIWQRAQNNLFTSQIKMKTHYDRKSQVRNFEAGEQVLVLLPIPGQFRAQFVGPAVVKKKLNDVDYLVEIPGRRKKYQLCHINIMKKYFSRANTVKSVSAVVPKECNGQEVESKEYGWNGKNSKILCNPDSLFKHLNVQEATDIKDLFIEHPTIFKDTPGLVRSLQHDVVLKPNAQLIRQTPYRLNPRKAEAGRKEVSYMLENDLITPSSSPWSSPVVLVKKENGQDRLCFDYRKVNDLTVADNFPLPRIEDCIDKIGNTKYISELDLFKGYWQVPLTENAREISAFITPEGLFKCKVMPFGMRNAASTFLRMMWMITNGLKGCVVYLDDIIIFRDNWKDHVDRIRALFHAIADAGLVINLSKCEFGKAGVIYLGHHVGQGKVLSKEKNIEAVLAFPTPKNSEKCKAICWSRWLLSQHTASFAFTTISHPHHQPTKVPGRQDRVTVTGRECGWKSSAQVLHVGGTGVMVVGEMASIRPHRRTALVTHAPQRYNIDIAALSETRLSEEDTLTEIV
ncbi:uncharacterized protein [Palaemon carinicauda]|uniref:uncharacterized protein n=1 Tax=Palaemon carinicauda TaxID=392227 RepID=UPI0035B622A3